MKTSALFIFIFCMSLSSFALTSDPPPSGHERGMYVDCADEIIDEVAAGITTKRDDLVQYAIDRHITYMALYKLDRQTNPILRSAVLQQALSDFIDYAKGQIPGLEIGMVVSSKTYIKDMDYYNYGHPNGHWPCAYYHDEVARMINQTLNPGKDAHKDTRVLAEMARSCVDVKFYNDGAPRELADGLPIVQHVFLLPHSGKIDWISIEYEFWHTAAWDATITNWSLEKAYHNYIELLDVARLISCGTGYRLQVESELSIIDNPKCTPRDSDPLHAGFIVGNYPDGQTQADEIDFRLHRILMVNYTRFSTDLFNRQCHNYFFVGNSSTNVYGSFHSRVWPLFSAEFPNIGQVRCSGAATGDCEAFLGLFLMPSSTTVSFTCDGIPSTSVDGGHDFEDAERLWLGQMTSATSCVHCGNTDYNAASTFVQNIADNNYDGFMWFTYSIMTQMNYHRIANGNSQSLITNLEYALFPNPTNTNFITLKTNGASGDYKIFDTIGKLVSFGYFSEGDKEKSIDLSGITDGVYNISILDDLGNYINNKFIVKKL